METTTGNSGNESHTMNVDASPKKVRAKVVCHEIVLCEGWDSKTQKSVEARRFKMQIVHGDSDENKLYAAVSGGTAVELQTINPEVFDMFKVKGQYYVDFTPAE